MTHAIRSFYNSCTFHRNNNEDNDRNSNKFYINKIIELIKDNSWYTIKIETDIADVLKNEHLEQTDLKHFSDMLTYAKNNYENQKSKCCFPDNSLNHPEAMESLNQLQEYINILIVEFLITIHPLPLINSKSEGTNGAEPTNSSSSDPNKQNPLSTSKVVSLYSNSSPELQVLIIKYLKYCLNKKHPRRSQLSALYEQLDELKKELKSCYHRDNTKEQLIAFIRDSIPNKTDFGYHENDTNFSEIDVLIRAFCISRYGFNLPNKLLEIDTMNEEITELFLNSDYPLSEINGEIDHPPSKEDYINGIIRLIKDKSWCTIKIEQDIAELLKNEDINKEFVEKYYCKLHSLKQDYNARKCKIDLLITGDSHRENVNHASNANTDLSTSNSRSYINVSPEDLQKDLENLQKETNIHIISFLLDIDQNKSTKPTIAFLYSKSSPQLKVWIIKCLNYWLSTNDKKIDNITVSPVYERLAHLYDVIVYFGENFNIRETDYLKNFMHQLKSTLLSRAVKVTAFETPSNSRSVDLTASVTPNLQSPQTVGSITMDTQDFREEEEDVLIVSSQ